MTNKILVTGYIPGINGISAHIHNVYRHLDRSRYDYVFVISKAYQDDEGLKTLKNLCADIVFVDYSKREFSNEGKSELKRLMLEIPNICGVHSHDVDRNVFPLLLADSLGLPVKVIQFHAGINKQMLECIDRHPEERADISLIKDSRFCRLACGELSGRGAYGDVSFEVFPNAVDCERYSPNSLYRTITRKKLMIPEDAPVIGFANHLITQKNPMFAAEVFSNINRTLPESHMIICGYGWMYNQMREFFKRKKLLSHVHFTGEQPQLEIFYNAMDVSIAPSIFEGVPNAVIEAQATGLPCLVSDMVDEMICMTDLVKRLSLTETPDRWANEAIRLLKEKKERRSYRTEIKAAGYEIGDAVEKLMQIYDNQRCLMMRSSTS